MTSNAVPLPLPCPEAFLIPVSAIGEYSVSECRFRDIRHLFEKYHYKGGHMGGGITACLMASWRGRALGGCVIGKPRHSGPYGGLLEIRRMAFVDEAPRNSESWFLGKALKWMRKNTGAKGCLSYSDRSVGHEGTIYKAANFKEAGETAPSVHVFWEGRRYHPRSLSIDRPYSYRQREAVKDGTATVETGKPKKIFTFMFR